MMGRGGTLYPRPVPVGQSDFRYGFERLGWGRPLTAQKGIRFIVRVHDPQQLLPQAEAVTGAALSAYVTAPSVPKFPLPVVFSDLNIRHYGTLVPINVAMSVTISSATVTLNNTTGAPLAASPIAFTILPTDVVVTGNPTAPPMFPPRDARIVHVYAAGLK